MWDNPEGGELNPADEDPQALQDTAVTMAAKFEQFRAGETGKGLIRSTWYNVEVRISNFETNGPGLIFIEAFSLS